VPTEDPEKMREAMKRVAVVLKEADVPFALAGGYASFARGGPESDHDVDFYLREDDVGRAEKVLAKAGLRVEHPAEDWLVKVYSHEDAMVDLIFRPTAMPVTTEILDRAEPIEVDSVEMPVLAATDLITSKLLAMDEHYCDLGQMFPVARALREQVDWPAVAERTRDNAFARAFLQVARDLDVVPIG
jgi:Uncharacterised nucleotidyltransferase